METIDACLARLEEAVTEAGAALMVTADHGNVEMMMDHESGQPHTAHTSFDVPVVMVNHAMDMGDGSLADVAPTMLDIMGIEQPANMTGKSLLSGTVFKAQVQQTA